MKRWGIELQAIRKYTAAFSLSLQKSMEYRMDFFMGILGTLVVILVQYFLWTAVFKGSAQAVVGGYTYQQLIVYTVFSGIVSKLVATGFEREIADDIKLGGLNKFLAQPVNYALFRFMAFLGEKLTQLLAGSALSLVLIFSLGEAWSVQRDPLTILLFFAAVLMGLVIHFFVFYIVSALAFVMTEVWGVFIAMRQGSFLLGGGIFPLDMMGAGIRSVVRFLPFEYTVFFPVSILNGRLQNGEILWGMLCQVFWIAALWAASHICWKAGLKKHIAAGG
jgi:ABC-2 type transport system permease protein